MTVRDGFRWAIGVYAAGILVGALSELLDEKSEFRKGLRQGFNASFNATAKQDPNELAHTDSDTE